MLLRRLSTSLSFQCIDNLLGPFNLTVLPDSESSLDALEIDDMSLIHLPRRYQPTSSTASSELELRASWTIPHDMEEMIPVKENPAVTSILPDIFKLPPDSTPRFRRLLHRYSILAVDSRQKTFHSTQSSCTIPADEPRWILRCSGEACI